MRFPCATAFFAAAMLGLYFYSTGGLLYPTAKAVGAFSFWGGNFMALFYHLLFHVGWLHLIGNLVPFVVFGWILETRLPSLHVAAMFLCAGVLGGLSFAVLNPGYALIGASAGIAGVMAAAVVVRPKLGIPALIFVPLLVFMVILPVASSASSSVISSLDTKKTGLEQQVSALLAENKTKEAAVANESLILVSSQLGQTVAGKALEEKTPTDAWAHLVGAIAGTLYLMCFCRRELDDGISEAEDSWLWLRNSIGL